MRKLLIIYLIFTLAACRHTQHGTQSSAATPESGGIETEMFATQYAEGFKIVRQNDGVWLVDIQDPQKEEHTSYHYALVDKQTKKGFIPDGYDKIEIPVSRVVCMTSLQLSNFIKLGKQNLVVGITSTRHLFDPTMNRQLKDGTTQKIGIEGNFDAEVILSINPEIILISPFKRGGYETLKEIGVPLIPHLGYKEMTPLGQAEWIRFIGLLTGNTDEADKIFNEKVQKYNDLKALTNNVNKRPIVFSGEIRGGNWYAVGGKSFLAQQFQDAGADYFLKDDKHSGGINLDFETVYSQAESADFWRIVNSSKGRFTYNALKEQDSRYADFKAFREKNIVYCNMSEHPFYESAPSEPEVILADLIKAFHPTLLPDYQPVYYKILK